MNIRAVSAGAVLLMVGGGLAGCGLRDKAETYTSPVATQALLVGLMNPYKDDIAIEDQLAMTVFVADVRQVTSMDRIADAPVTGAAVTVLNEQVDSELTEAASGGLYYATSAGGDGPTYRPDTNYEARVVASGETYTATASAAQATDFAEASTCQTSGQAVTLHLTGGTADRLMVAVYDAAGNQTYSNLPVNSDQLVAFLTSDSTGETFELPASAFPSADTLYGVVVAGVTEGGTYSENLNPLLSRFYVGAGRLGLIATYTDQTLCDALQSPSE